MVYRRQGAALPRAGHRLDRVAPAAASPHPAGAGGLGGPFPSSSMPPAAPFLSAAKEMGERTPPKTRGFWIPFWSISMRRKKVPQGIGHGPAPAAADVAGRDHWQFYRFKRLSNRALAAAGRKCRCGPLGREIRQASASPRGAWERQRLLSPSTGACHSTPPVRCAGAAAGMGADAIPYGPFCVVSRSA